MEEILRQLLDGQKQLFEGQNRIESRLGGIDTRLGGIDTRLGGIDTRLDGIDIRLDGIDTRLDGIDTRLECVEVQVQENSGFIKALVHQSEYQKVQMDQLVHTTARIEGEIKSIRTDLRAVEVITAKNWNDIIELRVAKMVLL